MSQIASGAKLWGELLYEGPEQNLGNFNGERGCGSDPSQSLSPSIMLKLSLPFLYCLPLQTLLSLHHIMSHAPPTLLFGTWKRALHKKSENMGCTTICKFHYYLPMWLWTRYFTDLKLSYFICKTGKKQTIFLRFDLGFNGKKEYSKTDRTFLFLVLRIKWEKKPELLGEFSSAIHTGGAAIVNTPCSLTVFPYTQ